MKPRSLATAGSSPAALPMPIVVAAANMPPEGFYSASRMQAPNMARSDEVRATPELRSLTRNVNISNYITVKVSVLNNFVPGTFAGQVAGGNRRLMPYIANMLLDGALRNELDREIALMARGEDIMSNRRRVKMLGSYLSTHPASVIRDFYSVRMTALAAQQSPPPEQGRFYHDIVNETSKATETTVVERHTETIVRPAAQAASINKSDMERIANQVAQKVEKRIKLGQERSGKWQL